MNVIAITGATGFIGDHLLDQLVHRKDIQLRILIHKNINNKVLNRNNIKIIEGDLLKSKTLNKFIIPRCTVVNLVYLSGRSKEENVVVPLSKFLCTSGAGRFFIGYSPFCLGGVF